MILSKRFLMAIGLGLFIGSANAMVEGPSLDDSYQDACVSKYTEIDGHLLKGPEVTAYLFSPTISQFVNEHQQFGNRVIYRLDDSTMLRQIESSSSVSSLQQRQRNC